MLYKPINRPSKYIFLLCYLLLKKLMEKIKCFESSNFMILRNGKVQYLKYNKKYLKSLSKQFAEHRKEKLFPNDPSFLI